MSLFEKMKLKLGEMGGDYETEVWDDKSLFEKMKLKLDELGVDYKTEVWDDNTDIIRQYLGIGDIGVGVCVILAFDPEKNVIQILTSEMLTVEVGTTQIQRALEVCNEFNYSYLGFKMFLTPDGDVSIKRDVEKESASPERLVDLISILLGILQGTDYLKRLLKIRWS